MLASLLLSASLAGPAPTFAAPASNIRVVRVPIVTGAPLQFVRLPWKSARFEVKRITQDNKGFLWFGASDDLRRYDGVRFIGLPRESPGQRSSGFILSESMMKDRAGMIWFGVDDFVNRYDPETGSTSNSAPARGMLVARLVMPCTSARTTKSACGSPPIETAPPQPGDLAGHVLSRFCQRRFASRSDHAHLHPRVAQRWTLGRQRRRARSARSAQRPGHTAFRARNSVRRAPSLRRR